MLNYLLTMKRIYLLFAVVAAQLLWLGWNYAERARELAESPVIHIDCTDYDPRDLFRGDYVNIQTRQTVPLELAGTSLYWDEAFCAEVNKYTHWDYETKKDIEHPVLNPVSPRPCPEVKGAEKLCPGYGTKRVAVFWKQGDDGVHGVSRVEAAGSEVDIPAEGEIRTLMWYRVDQVSDETEEEERTVSVKQYVKLVLSFTSSSWEGMRFYVEEGTGNIRHLWLNEVEGKDNVPFESVRRTVDIVIRENAPVIPRMLYLNGVPYPEAVEQIRNKTFKWE